MAGGKKKKKPASNPARGFATTSIASKQPKVDSAESESAAEQAQPHQPETHESSTAAAPEFAKAIEETLTAEEF